MSAQPGKKRRRFLAPQEKYEIWMQLVRGEITVGDAAETGGWSTRAACRYLELSQRRLERISLDQGCVDLSEPQRLHGPLINTSTQTDHPHGHK